MRPRLLVPVDLTGAPTDLDPAVIGEAADNVKRLVRGGAAIVFRGTPEILVLLLFYFGSAITLTAVAQVFDPEIKFVDLPPFWAGSLAIALIVGS